MNKYMSNYLVALASLALAGCQPEGKSTPFEPLRKLVVQGQYDKAVPALKDYIDKHPGGKHASRAGLFLFKASLAKGDYDEATRWCEWTLQNHPDSLEARKCEFKLGLIQLAKEDLPEALKQFETVASSNQNPLRPEAEFFVDHLRAQMGAENRGDPVGVGQE